MTRKRYQAPVFMTSSGGDGGVTGQGSGQGSIAPQGMSYEEWWEEIAWEGENLDDADYNGDGVVDRADYDYYIANHLWDPDE